MRRALPAGAISDAPLSVCQENVDPSECLYAAKRGKNTVAGRPFVIPFMKRRKRLRDLDF